MHEDRDVDTGGPTQPGDAAADEHHQTYDLARSVGWRQ